MRMIIEHPVMYDYAWCRLDVFIAYILSWPSRLDHDHA